MLVTLSSLFRTSLPQDVRSNEKDEKDNGAEAHCDAAVNPSYNDLFLFLRKEHFGNPQVMTMVDLSSRLATSITLLVLPKLRNQPKSTSWNLAQLPR